MTGFQNEPETFRIERRLEQRIERVEQRLEQKVDRTDQRLEQKIDWLSQRVNDLTVWGMIMLTVVIFTILVIVSQLPRTQ